MSDSSQPHGPQHARPPCPSPTPGPPKPMSIESVMPSKHPILCCPLLLLPSIFPSIRVFSNESVLHIRWPNYWSFSFSISSSNEHPGLISFRMDWLDLLDDGGTTWFFLSCGGILELRRGIHASCSTGPGKSSFHSNCELELGIALETLQGQIDLI